MVMVGWPRPDVTRLLPSQRNRFFTSWVRWYCVDHRGRRIVAHAAGAQQVHRELLLVDGRDRRFTAARRPHRRISAAAILAAKSRSLQIVRMILVGHAHRRQAPGILEVGIERKTVGLERQRSAVQVNLHGAREVALSARLEGRCPTEGPVGRPR